MNKKFAAVGLGLSLVLGLTNCTGSIAEAEQLNIETKTIVKESVLMNPIVSLTLLQRTQLRLQKVEKNTTKMNKVLKYLKSRHNKTPYVFAGSHPEWGWDCSGLVRWTYENFGIELRHSATAQGHVGKKVSYKDAKPGDIVTFSWGSDYWRYHAAIYLGNGMIIDANSGYGTTIIEPLTNFKGNKISFRRLIETN
jgi:cell wall-associated NlpC family hydrolase